MLLKLSFEMLMITHSITVIAILKQD